MDTNSNNSKIDNEEMNKDNNMEINENGQQIEENNDEPYYEEVIEEQDNQSEENSIVTQENDLDGSNTTIRKTNKKKKQSGRFIPRTFITIMIILLLATLSVASYVPVRNSIVNRQDQIRHYVESYRFSNQIYNFSQHLVEEFNQELNKEAGTKEKSYYHNYYKNIESIKYHITDSRGRLTLTNTNTISNEDLKEARFFLRIQTDDAGNLSIEYTEGMAFEEHDFRWSFIPNIQTEKSDAIKIIDKNEYNRMTDEEKERYKEELSGTVGALHIYDASSNSVEIVDIPILDEELIRLMKEKAKHSNLEITYLVDDNIFEGNDIFADGMQNSMLELYAYIILGIAIISTIVLIILAFSMPYSFQSKIPICHVFNKMFFELKVLCYALLIPIGYELLILIGGAVASSFITDAIINTNSYFYGIGIPLVFKLFALIYLLIVYIKYIYYEGTKEGLIRNSLTGRIVLKIGSSCYRFYKQMITIDISKNSNWKLVLIALTSTIVLFVIAVMYPGPIPILLAIAYGGFLFKYLLGLIENVRSLSEGSSHLAKGNFNVSLEEDMGMLSPVAKNLNNIRLGFSRAVHKATKSQKMKTELISNVSHDLKTPLTSIITYVDLLKNGDVDAQKQAEYIDILDKKAKRLKVLIEDLFEASKASSGNIDLQLEKLDVNALFRQTLGELEEKLNNSSLIIRLNVPENKIMCYLDGRRTYRIFENVMSNILKYSMKGSRVYIDIIEDEKNVQFIFRNISAYEMTFDVNDITDRFTRGEKSRNTDGSGLGLAIAKSLVELQNGKLTINVDGDLFKLTIAFPKDDSIVEETIEQ